MIDAVNHQRSFSIIQAQNGGVVVTEHDKPEVLGAYNSAFEALADIARDLGFEISLVPGQHQASGQGFYPKPVNLGTASQYNVQSASDETEAMRYHRARNLGGL